MNRIAVANSAAAIMARYDADRLHSPCMTVCCVPQVCSVLKCTPRSTEITAIHCHVTSYMRRCTCAAMYIF